jgi:hypothetical protein
MKDAEILEKLELNGEKDESTEFYAMHEVERYETKVFKFKRL